ncbi:MAG: hypothetical protein D8B47_00585 [Kingella sp. (in: b-proteobacteria)]|nr:MAG: hypothetical protein D8B47_00585 [Kingella sp. (in: b-proteobacteria)]
MGSVGTPSAQPAAFRRLCVETVRFLCERRKRQPAAFRRLCVETGVHSLPRRRQMPSRLRAAVC